MLKIHKYEEKTREKAIEKLIFNLNSSEDGLIIKETEIEAKLFKSKRVELSAIVKKELIDYIKNYINTLSELMGIEITTEIIIRESLIKINLLTSNNSVMIGKDGRTLNAIQLLINQKLYNLSPFKFFINLDISNYKNNKIEDIITEVEKIAVDVINTRIDIQLDNMNSYERRIVHKLISKYENLETKSIGTAPNRYIMIKYKPIKK